MSKGGVHGQSDDSRLAFVFAAGSVIVVGLAEAARIAGGFGFSPAIHRLVTSAEGSRARVTIDVDHGVELSAGRTLQVVTLPFRCRW